MATYKQIENWVKQNHGFVPKGCWIAHCKEMEGLEPKISSRRYDPNIRQVPCPLEKRKPIIEAIRYLDGKTKMEYKMPIQHRTERSKIMGKYSPLGEFLNSQNSNHIPMTFAEIERILGAPLPASKQYPAWWSNNTSNNVMTRQWLDAGYQTESVNIAGEKLVFRRVRNFDKSNTPSPQKPSSSFEDKIDATRSFKPYRSPIFGCMEGTVTIPDDVDLTDPAFPEWPQMIEEKYPKN